MFKFADSTTTVGELQLNSISLNIDVPALKNMIHESNLEIADLSESYDALYEAAVEEGGGEETGDAKKVKGQALKHAGEKILKALKQLWDWIANLAKSIADRIMGLVVNNEKFLTIYKPKVAAVMAHATEEQKKKMIFKGYEYNIQGKLKKPFAQAVEGLDATQETEVLKLKFVNELAGVSGQTLKAARQEFYKALRGGAEKKKEIAFDQALAERFITGFKDLKEEVVKDIEAVKKAVASAIAEVKSEISSLDKKDNASTIRDLNLKRKKLNIAASLYVELLNMKLAAAVERMRVARAVYTKVGNMKAKTESAGFYEGMGVFSPLTESYMAEEEGTSFLNESANLGW